MARRPTRLHRWQDSRRGHLRQTVAKRRWLSLELLESRCVLDGEWTNEFNPRDVTGDGAVVPIDVLVAINQLNARTVIADDGKLPDRAAHPSAPFWDTNGDGFLVPIDVLLVVNALNQDETAPTIVVGLIRDTAPFDSTNNDRISAAAAVSGVVTDDLTGITSLTAKVDDGAAQIVTVERSGAFEFDPGFASDGSDDGLRRITLTGNDGTQHSTVLEFDFVFDTTAPDSPLVRLSTTSDSGTIGDGVTRFGRITLLGETETGATLRVDELDRIALASNEGWLFVSNIPLQLGENNFALQLSDRAGNLRSSSVSIQREEGALASDPGDVPVG